MHPYLFNGLDCGPKTVRTLLTQIDPARFDERLSPDRFSLREVVAHLADWEPVVRFRIQTALSNPGGPVPIFDEEARVVEGGYADKDPVKTVREWEEERTATCELLQSLGLDQFEATITHPQYGRMTVYDLANLLVGHDAYHVEQLSNYVGDKTVATW